ncbi:hypothetical protein BDR04DRAFT_1117272 [Suillus decipiens]|nr:hypothetical protein BDR04DRAFT_1117272 [Suillus decipiens]
MTPSQQQEVKFAMKKWNEEGAPEEAQAIYHKNNLKKTLEDFTEQMWGTMGCRIVMLNAKKIFSVSSSGIKEWTANGFESFGEWSKTEFYPSEDSDHVASDLDDDGYAKLPIRDGIGLKGQHELIRSIFHMSYIPTGFMVKDPSHMKTEEAKDANIQVPGRSKMKVVSTLDSDEEDKGQLVPFPSHVTECRTQLATHTHETTPDNVAIDKQYTFLETLSKNENYLELVDAIRDLAILAKQKPISEQHQDLPIWADWSWSKVYLPEDVHSSYAALASLNKLQTYPISGLPSAMPVVLGIGLLYRESKHVIEYEEDEAGPNTPFYLPHSVIDLQFLVSLDNAVQEVLLAVVEHIERLTKEGLGDEDEDSVMRMRTQ